MVVKMERAARKPKVANEPTLDERITAVCSASQKLGSEIHSVAVACLIHAQEHSDPRKLDRLIKGLHGANGPIALTAWAKEYSPITWNGDGEVKMIPSTSKLFKPFDIDGADQNPYWLKIDVKKSPLTFDKLVAVLAGMEKRVTKAEEDGNVGEGENVEAMHLLARMAAKIATDAKAAKDAVTPATVVTAAKAPRNAPQAEQVAVH